MIVRTSSATRTLAAAHAPTWRQLGLSPSAKRLVASAWLRSRDPGLRRLRHATRAGR
jgi:hypothetical protein